MKKLALALLLFLPLAGQAQNVVSEARQKAEEARKAAEEAARKAEEARIAAQKAELAALEAAEAEAKAKTETEKPQNDQPEAAKTATATTPGTSQWESKSETKKNTVESGVDAKYLAGAVTENNGQVEWQLALDVPGRDATWIYDKLGQLFTDMTHGENQLAQSRIALADSNEHTLAARFQEWLVFKSNMLSLDRTEFDYTLIAKCSDSHADISLGRIYYKYEVERNPNNLFKAEEWITDKYSLNKAKTKLAKNTGKFRQKTIDRKDEIFKAIKTTLLATE